MNNSLVGKRVRVLWDKFTIDGDIMYEPASEGDCWVLNNVTNICRPELRYGDGIRVQKFNIMFPLPVRNVTGEEK
jgi:hypothetical protein